MTRLITDSIKLKFKFIAFYYFLLITSSAISKILLTPFKSILSDELIRPLFSSIIVIPLLYFSMKIACEGDCLKGNLKYLGFKKISIRTTTLVIGSTAVIKLIESLITATFNIQLEPFFNNISGHFENYLYSTFLFFTICLVIPIYEEILFRGWLVKKLLELKISHSYIIGLNGSLFAIMHPQYNHVISYIFLFILGSFVCWLRLKTNNLAYSIISHCIFNFVAFLALFIHFSFV